MDVALDAFVDEIEALWQRGAIRSRRSLVPVSSRCDCIGTRPALATASMNLAEVPRSVTPVSSARSNRTLPSG